MAFAAIVTQAQAQEEDPFVHRLLPICDFGSDHISDPAKSPAKVGSHANASLTSAGSPKVPVILVQFNDLFFTSGLGTHVDEAGNTVKNDCLTETQKDSVNSFYDKFCNGLRDGSYYTGAGSRGAVSEYFRDQSYGQFTPEFVVIGPVTLGKSYAYYGEDTGGSKDIHIYDFYREAISQAQQLCTNWDQFDNDGNGNVDMAFFIYAGEGQNAHSSQDEYKTLIWPKEEASGGNINGLRYGAYACTNELLGSYTDGIGCFTHELSHALGLPDFYDTNYVGYGLDYWDIMDGGCYCRNGFAPCGYSAYERDFMGWQQLITLDGTQIQHIKAEPTWNGGAGYKMVNPENENEYYVIENRQNRRWDAYIGRGDSQHLCHGLLITHVDYNRSAWIGNHVNTNASHQRMTIVPADGKLDSYNNVTTQEEFVAAQVSAQGDLYPGTTNTTALTGAKATVFTTTGATPGLMGQCIMNIVENSDGSIEFDYLPDASKETGIADIISPDQLLPIHSISGITVGQGTLRQAVSLQLQLPTGIYIIGGAKIVIK